MKTNKVVKMLMMLVIPCLFWTCVREKGEHKFITFINYSEDSVFISEKWRIKINFFDTLYECNNVAIKVLSKDSCQLQSSNYYWETDFNVIPFVQYFVFPRRTSFYTSCEEARKYQLKRYLLTEENLDSLNWTITYP